MVKKLKKRWFPIYATDTFNNVLLGESYVTSPEVLVGRRVILNLASVIPSFKSQNAQVKFEIFKADSEKAVAEIHSFELLPSYVKRIVKKRTSKVTDSFVVRTKDDVLVRVKPLLITQSKVSKRVQSALRKATRVEVAKIASTKTYTEFMSMIVQFKLQAELANVLKKIMPLRNAEINKALKVNVAKWIVEPPVEEVKEEKPKKSSKKKTTSKK